MAAERKVVGYLPNDTPPLGQLILLGFQHVLTMFPATVFVAAFTGFHIGTVLLASGISTIVALVLSRRGIGKFIPLFYGSSFSYIAAYLGIVVQMTGELPAFGVPVADNVISTMQAGIVVTGVLNVIVGFVIRAVGKEAVDKVLPPVVTGSVAAIIGFGLAFAALGMANDNWLEFTVRYIVDYKRRRGTKDQLFTRILEELDKTDGRIAIASMTIQIVETPAFDVRLREG